MDDESDLGELFDGAVVPEATPSPRTIRFATPPLGDGPSRVFDANGAADDPRVARIFGVTDEVTNVLVGPTFVAVTIQRPDQWASLLTPVLRAVTDAFTEDDRSTPDTEPPAVLTLGSDAKVVDAHEPRRLERAWIELGALQAGDGQGLDRVIAASRDAEAARRQVAAVLLADAEPAAAARAWARLLGDPSRSVRRSVVDTMSDACRAELRPLLEQALDDADPWIRWRALRGIAALGVTPSRAVVEALVTDPDFRVRLESTRALRGSGQ